MIEKREADDTVGVLADRLERIAITLHVGRAAGASARGADSIMDVVKKLRSMMLVETLAEALYEELEADGGGTLESAWFSMEDSEDPDVLANQEALREVLRRVTHRLGR